MLWRFCTELALGQLWQMTLAQLHFANHPKIIRSIFFKRSQPDNPCVWQRNSNQPTVSNKAFPSVGTTLFYNHSSCIKSITVLLHVVILYVSLGLYLINNSVIYVFILYVSLGLCQINNRTVLLCVVMLIVYLGFYQINNSVIAYHHTVRISRLVSNQ